MTVSGASSEAAVRVSRADISNAERLSAAWKDFAEGIDARELWFFLGWRDVQKHYRRSVLGPLWLTLSMGIMVAGIGVLYAQIFKTEIHHYLPFLTVGFVVWGLISGCLIGACTVFSNSAGSIRQIKLPLSVYIFQFVWAQFITFAHNLVIYVIVILIFGLNPGWTVLLAIPALGLIGLCAIFCSMILGPLCARFRDIPLIMTSFVQVVFFMTPIIWSASQIPDRAHFVEFNPFFHFVEIARAPLLGSPGTATNWLASLGVTVVLGVVAVAFFSRFRTRIAYWA
jgi:ABC-2 type transport system permease protein